MRKWRDLAGRQTFIVVQVLGDNGPADMRFVKKKDRGEKISHIKVRKLQQFSFTIKQR